MSTSRLKDSAGGARVRFQDGRAVLMPASEAPPSSAAPVASIVSPGTESRRLRGTVGGEAREAGYMTIARRPPDGTMLLAPVPHGSWIDPGNPKALLAEPGVAMQMVAAARFQLIAALGMRHPACPAQVGRALVIGSGPVALGCCLELRRRGVQHVALLTRRAEVPYAAGLGAEVTGSVPRAAAPLVLDTTGDGERAVQAVAERGVVGLVGSPDPCLALSATLIHRRGVAVIGMHELAGYDHAGYQREFTAILAWLSANFDSATVGSWCLRIGEAQVEPFYRSLSSPSDRPVQPITLLEWC